MKWMKKNEKINTLKDYFLNNMGVESTDVINAWCVKSMRNEYRLDGVIEAVELIKKFKEKPIKVVGDYDVDGITSTTILVSGLKKYGCTNVTYRIPKRFTEGFGINPSIINETDEGLIITCDNGIAQSETIKYAKKKGLSVIIIDHHLPEVINGNTIIPNADVVIDPNAISDSADFNGYCGAGLCYKVISELLGYNKAITNKYLSLAALGTVADVMEIREENYCIIRSGLKTLAETQTCSIGLHSLLEVLELTNKTIQAQDIAFSVGPVINSVSRLNNDGASLAVDLLLYDDEENITTAKYNANLLVEYNKTRKELQKEALEKAINTIEVENLASQIPLVVYLKDTKEGILGIIAGQLCEQFKVPTIVVTNTENGILKGSARSCGNYHMKNSLDEVSYLLENYGGHEGAAGLSFKEEYLDILRKELSSNLDNFLVNEVDTIYYDLEITPEEIPGMITEMAKYGPYGEGNPVPVFMLSGFRPSLSFDKKGRKMLIGAEKTTVKYNGNGFSAIGFHLSDLLKGVDPEEVSLIGTLSDNIYNGRISHQICFEDIHF